MYVCIHFFWLTFIYKWNCCIMRKEYIKFHQKQQGCTILHSYQQCLRVPAALHLYPQLVFQIFSILVRIQVYLNVVLIFNSVMTNDVDHFLICLLAIWISFVKYLFKSLVHFLNYCCLTVKASDTILDQPHNLYSVHISENIPPTQRHSIFTQSCALAMRKENRLMVAKDWEQ